VALPYLAGPLPRIFAHRGLATAHPENTFGAFAAAVAAGADYLETDAHVTSDGIAVLAHDPVVLDKGRPIEIAATTWGRLATIELGNGARLPRLDETLAAFPDARFNIDVKAAAAVVSVAAAIDAADARDRVLVTSFDGATRRAAVAALTGVATSASSDLIIRSALPAHAGLVALTRRALIGVPCVQIPERHRGLPLVTPRTVRTFHRAGIEVHVWTVNAADDMLRLAQMGVDGIVTDRCDIAVEVFRR
jgi:glycerophosphoryl diester phosphodiesterase